jgi:hypothetical protein
MANAGGNIRTDQRELTNIIARLLARMDAQDQRLESYAKDFALIAEQVGIIREMMVRAADSTRGPPPDGPIAKLLAGRQKLEEGAPGVVRDLLAEVLAEATDSAVVAEAYYHTAHSYDMERKRAEADSVFRSVYERYPASQFAPSAMYRYGISLLDATRTDEGVAILRRVVADYPTSVEAQQAKTRIPPTQAK